MATNAAIPGFGTLLAGKTFTGILQAILGLLGLGLTLIFGVRLLVWALANWSRIRDPYGDPLANLLEMWLVMRWPLAGILCFGIAWIWAFLSSLRLLGKTPKTSPARVPPPV